MGDPGSIPGSGRSPGEGNGNSLWYSYLENSMNRGAWQATWGHRESGTTEVTEHSDHYYFFSLLLQLPPWLGWVLAA